MRQCVILVGGKGLRLGELTKNTPKPITKLTYQLVYDFINHNKPEDSQQLPAFLESNLGTAFSDKAVLNRIGYKRMDKETTAAWGLELLKLNTQLFPNDGNL